jgi:hypothetical protein
MKLNLYLKFYFQLLLELNKKVFGKITTKEIIGANPPAIPDTDDILKNEFTILLEDLKSQPQENLEKLLEKQKIAEAHINSRPGAMALAQDKIQLFNEYNNKYIQTIQEKLKS